MDERIIKYCSGELSQEEESLLLEEAYRNPELKAAIVEYQHLHTLVGLQATPADHHEGKRRLKQFKQRMELHKRRTILLTWGRYAAVILLSFALAWFIESRTDTSIDLSDLQQELYVPAGQRARLTLSDGTEVWLNAGSRLSYPSVFGQERKVALTGEAFFKVTSDKKHPFIVSTQSIDVKAVGTEFNVRSYPSTEQTAVYLQEGAVLTYFPGQEKGGYLMQPGQLLLQEGKTFTLKRMDPDELLWREGIYVFKGERMEEIVKKLELYYDVNIVVKHADILDYKYVGKFRQSDGVMTILQVIQRIHRFSIKKDEEKNEIILYK
ncbi:MAG: FecR domain-containing protein [Bacteroides sp.]|nr:FecR domain-containing protein [Bacteroides sp.]